MAPGFRRLSRSQRLAEENAASWEWGEPRDNMLEFYHAEDEHSSTDRVFKRTNYDENAKHLSAA
jgi:hypothetical protein